MDGVGQVTSAAARSPAVRVDVNPTQLAGAGLGIDDVRTALAAANANRPKGTIEDAHQAWSVATTRPALDRR